VRRVLAGFLLAACALAAGACAPSGYDARKLERQLRAAGLTSEQAACVTDELESTFLVLDLGSHSEPTSQEVEKTRAIVKSCAAPPR
jgi:hypothetical protein